jgi:hypothetical protein
MARTRIQSHHFKPFLASSTTTADPGFDYTEWPEVTMALGRLARRGVTTGMTASSPTITYGRRRIDLLVCGDGGVGALRTIASSQVQCSNNLLGRASRLNSQRLVRGRRDAALRSSDAEMETTWDGLPVAGEHPVCLMRCRCVGV